MEIIEEKRVITYKFKGAIEMFRVDVETSAENDTVDINFYYPGWGSPMLMASLTESEMKEQNISVESIIRANINHYSNLFYEENLLSMVD